MIKVEEIDTWGFEHAVRAMRNPMNSWKKSDSGWGAITNDLYSFDIGENDLVLMRKLYKAGTEHRTYARMIQVSMDITAPLYWWKEMDRYTVGKSQVSCSTMHKIADKEFTLDDFSHEHLLPEAKEVLEVTIGVMNTYRLLYLEANDKVLWWQLIQLLPSSYNQERTICMSYETVFKIIKERTGHKLDEWHALIETLRSLPYINEIITEESK